MFEWKSPTTASGRSYNLFRNRERPALLCAVPLDRPVPAFITIECWSIERATDGLQTIQSFSRLLAEESVRFNGFYLYYEVKSPRASNGNDLQSKAA